MNETRPAETSDAEGSLRQGGPVPLWLRSDLWAGIATLAFGALVLWVGQDYPAGRGGRIGPGYVPGLLGLILVGLGLFLALRARWVTAPLDLVFRPRPVVLVIASVLVFALVFSWGGLVPAVLAAVFVANWASSDNGWASALAVGVLLALFSWGLFVVALKLPMPVIRF